RMCSALWYFWSVRGHLAEGRRWLAAALAAVPAEHPALGRSPLRARALTGAGGLAHDQSDYAAAEALLEESLALWRTLEGSQQANERGLAHALVCLANVRLDQDRADAALSLYEEALALYRALGDGTGAAMALSNLGV